MIRHILAVCVGNICRSPAAEALLSKRLPGLTVSSAGLGAMTGSPIHPTMKNILLRQDIDASVHRARPLASWMIHQADLVLVMEFAHKAEIERKFPQCRGRVFRLGHYLDTEIPDPYLQADRVFEDCFSMIELSVDQWEARVRRIGYEATAA